MQDMATIFALNVFRLPVSLQVAIKFVLSLNFFGALIARKFLFFRMRLSVAGKIFLWNQFPAGLAKCVVHFEITQRINV